MGKSKELQLAIQAAKAAGVLLVNAAGGYAEMELVEDYKCICRCFATKDLLEDCRLHFYKPKLEA